MFLKTIGDGFIAWTQHKVKYVTQNINITNFILLFKLNSYKFTAGKYRNIDSMSE